MRRMIVGPSLYRAGSRWPVVADYDELVDRDAMGVLPDGTIKFLLLRDAIPKQMADKLFRTLNVLPFNPARNSRRAAIRGSIGGELAFGWMDHKPGGPRFLAPANHCAIAYHFALLPLLNAMSNFMVQHLPAQWQTQARTARQNGHMTIGAEWLNPDTVAIHRPGMFGRRLPLLSTPVFSTITMNKNVASRLHCDDGNQRGLACMTAFGKWKGAELCFPRLGVAFSLTPGDMLFADTARELHGNAVPFMGTRISVVAYLRSLM